jgi:polysaccharide deacetylase family sporulation protein PdaB
MKKRVNILTKLCRSSLFWLIVVLFLFGLTLYIPTVVSVSTSPNSKELPIYSVDTDKKVVALSFDAAWGNEDTQAILDILKKHNIKVTFFMTGGWVESYPDDVKAIAAAGHDLGNHSENHKHMSELGEEDIKTEIVKVHDKVKALTGVDMELFRPPYGDYNNTLITTVKGLNYYPIQWSVDSLDWKDYGADDIVKKVCENKNLGNGAIILMHNGAKYTKDALENVIVGLENEGYEIVPISKLIIHEKYHMDHTGKQIAD